MTYVDARTVPDGSEVETDVCVVGAGAAGITIGQELQGGPDRVILLESGGLEPDRETQQLYEGENVGFPYYPLSTSRLRFFGGTTNHWTGACRPLDDVDFEERDWVPRSGWPLTRAELEPYYRRAHSICDLGPLDYRPRLWEDEDARALPLASGRFGTSMYRLSPPTRFGEKFRSLLDRRTNVTTYLHGNAVGLETEAAGDRIGHVRVACLTGTRFRIRARTFVVATGTIENARFLLNCLGEGGIDPGPSADWIGRCFMEHVSVMGGVFLASDHRLSAALYRRRPSEDGTPGYGVLTPSPEVMARERILHAKIRITPTSVREGLRSVAPGLVAASVAAQTGRLFEEWSSHVGNVASEVDRLAIYSYERIFRPPAAGPSYYLNFHLEQSPDRESRVTLADETDRLGKRRARLSWTFGELERRTLRRLCVLLGAEVGAAGIGRLWEAPDERGAQWPAGVRGAWHQMGTTRMSSDPSRGVVDAACRVHGTENLFIAGGSVFPTVGHANPTLTITALAIRLADHIRGLRA